MKAFIIFTIIFLANIPALAGADAMKKAAAISFDTRQPRQGDCFVVHLREVSEAAKPEVTWGDKKLPMFWGKAGWHIILPVWMETAPGPQPLSVSWMDAEGQAQSAKATITIKPRAFGKQYLRLAAEQEALYTNPGVDREYTLIRGALARLSPAAAWTGKFLVPVAGRQSTAFGLTRYRNGEKQSQHKGIDYSAKSGVPVKAANSGTVALTAEDFKMHGKTVVIDHGQGVCTLYLHLSKILVKPGQVVKKGKRIALVGATGVATGPHLHYALYVAGIAVDLAWWESQAR